MSDTNQDRKKAVREAWKNEKSHVREGKGTRDWSQSEQKQIVAKGRANGYEGHHMKSVKQYPQHAADPNNIQFLNRSEHVNGAHKGDTKNATNGYYNHKTGQTHSFGNRNPQAPQSQALSAPLTQRQQNLAVKREQARQQAAKQAKTEAKQAATKSIQDNTPTQATNSNKMNSNAPVTTTNQVATNKGIESMRNQAAKTQANSSSSANQFSNNKGIEASRQKASANQSVKTSNESTNQGIKSYQSRSNGQPTTAGSRSSAGSAAKGASSGSSNSSSGQSSGNSGQGR